MPGGNGGGPFGNMFGLVQRFQQFMQNPMAAFISSGMSVPQNIQNNPDAILNYMKSSGQMTEDQFNQAQQFAQQFQNFMPKKF